MNTELIARLRDYTNCTDGDIDKAADALEAAQADAQSLGEVILKMGAAKVHAEQERDAALTRLAKLVEKLDMRIGIYPASVDGVLRTERQDGWNDCSTEVTAILEELDVKAYMRAILEPTPIRARSKT